MSELMRHKGNEQFKAGEYREAEYYYTSGIQRNSTDRLLFSNRALTRLRLQEWRNAETDARKAIELYGPGNNAAMKAYYYLAQALVEQRHTTEALIVAQEAYRFCLETNDSSTETLSRFILRAKQAHWQTKETARLRELNQTLGVVEGLLESQLERDHGSVEHRFSMGEIGYTGRMEEKEQLDKDAAERRKTIRAAFADSNNKDTAERVVPDWMVDAITFEVMHDPVITPSGHSYERVGLIKHIKNAGTDPLTREPLTVNQLVPNIGLRIACSEFLENNGWAVDY